MKRVTIKPGATVPESGIYHDTSSPRHERSTLREDHPAPPVARRGGQWELDVRTNPPRRGR